MALDVIFLSYDEPCADQYFNKLLEYCPYAKRVHGVSGIREAHHTVAEAASTSSFFVVDGDSEVSSMCQDVFSFKPDAWDRKYVHIWNSLNPVNGLIYGYGGIKLMHKSMFQELTTDAYIDFTTRLGSGIKMMGAPDTYGSITHFNSSAFHAWKGALREAAKLKREGSTESVDRLNVWLHKQDPTAAFHKEVRRGAWAGHLYAHHGGDISHINNNDWLKEKYAISSGSL